VTAAAAVGGTASRLGGGSFTNGAVTAAFARLFNDEAHRRKIASSYSVEGEDLSESQKNKMDTLMVDVSDALTKVPAPWLGDYDRIEVRVSADDVGSEGQGADARIERRRIGRTGRTEKVGVVTIYRDALKGTHGDVLALFGHELYHFEPTNWRAYSRHGNIPATQYPADRFGNRLASALYDIDYSRMGPGIRYAFQNERRAP
jgi:hypothetical protein